MREDKRLKWRAWSSPLFWIITILLFALSFNPNLKLSALPLMAQILGELLSSMFFSLIVYTIVHFIRRPFKKRKIEREGKDGKTEYQS